MGRVCKDVCYKYKSKHQRYYERGSKRCRVCQMMLYYDGIFCPCCNGFLRTHPRRSSENTRYKTRMNIIQVRY